MSTDRDPAAEPETTTKVAPARDTLEVGQVLADYRITAVLGQGGFGITYKAFDQVLERDVAIKEYLPRQFAWRRADLTVIPRSDGDAETFSWGLNRFVDEARALARFKHPNIVAVLRFLEANGTAYLVMEYEEGTDLERWVAGRADGIAEQTLVEGILSPLLDGLERVHEKGLLHRDIKPENVFIRRDGSPVLIDFGASRPHGAGAASQMTSIISAGYSPFEQYGGSRQGPWTDLYALAGTAYRIIAGQAPTDAIARQQGQTLPPAVDVGRGRYSEQLLAAIDRTLALDPAARPQSAAELRALIRGETYRAGRAPSADGTWDPHATQVNRDSPRHTPGSARPRRRMLAVVATLVLAAAGASAWYGWSWYQQSAPDAVVADAPALEQADEPFDQAPAPDAEAVTADTDSAPQPPIEREPEPEPVATIEPELALLSGLDMPDAVREFRNGQIAGALLAYVSNKERFEACVDSGCPDQLALMTRVQEAQQGYAWERAPFAGTLRIANPRWLPDNDNCPHLIDVHEQIETASLRRSQVRTYCTRNGFDRVLQTAGAVDDAFR